MWTLRDLWFLLNPDAEDEWRQNKAKRMSMGEPMSLRDVLQNRNYQINASPSLEDITTNPQQDYGQGIDNGWWRHKYPPKYKGQL
jgi:hypothetical protein